jgi:hypothetical protein
MSSDRNPGEQFALTILIVVLLGLACAWLAGCASSRPLQPETAPPTPAEMAALLERPVAARQAAPTHAGKPDDVTLVVLPRIVLWGGAVRLRCLVNDAPDVRGAVRLALEGTRVTTAELPNSIEQSILIERLPCGKSVASCVVRRAGRADVLRTETVDVRGGMCADDGGAK